ncbi:uncharacterized protein [Littorina saxatilis]|uniref:uncharacterized protein n=1 Tax=Littorina saxatilis TaxID=31220 RepID=UPI0038B65651
MSSFRLIMSLPCRASSVWFVAFLVAATAVIAARTEADDKTHVMDTNNTDIFSGIDAFNSAVHGHNENKTLEANAGDREHGERKDLVNLNSRERSLLKGDRYVSSRVNDQQLDVSPLYNLPDEPYVASAVNKSFHAQNELCGSYCNGTSFISLENDQCLTLEGVRCSTCYCDEMCKHYRDCCPQVGSDDLPDVTRADIHQCQEIMFGFERRFVKVIATCPPGETSQKGFAEDCPCCGGNVSSLVMSLATGAIYCNTHYGECNGDMRLVTLSQATCLDTQEKVFVSNHRNEQNWPIIPNRPCRQGGADVMTTHIETCDKIKTAGGDLIEELCRQYSYPVFYRGFSYRNLFCALCNLDAVVPSNDGCSSQQKTFTQSAVITSLRPLYVDTYDTVAPSKCEEHQWYDVVLDKCRNVTCETGRTRTPGLPYCADLTAYNSSVLFYHIGLTFTMLTNATHVPCLNDWTLAKGVITAYLAVAMQQLTVTTYAIQVSDIWTYKGSFKTYVQFATPKLENQTLFELQLIKDLTNSWLSLNVLDDKTIEFRTNLESYASSVGGSFSVSYRNGSCCSREDPYFEYSVLLNHTIADIDSNGLTRILLGPLTPFTQVVLNSSEFEVVPGGELEVTLTYVNVSLPMWQIRKYSGRHYVPTVYLQQAYREAGLTPESTRMLRVSRHWSLPGEETLFLCCVIVSIVSLIFLLITYCVFSQLRTLPGLNNMWLAGWLLLAQVLLFMVPGRTDFNGCHVLGMLLHYAWLCVISWSCVCSFHMFHVFVTQRDTLHAPHRQRWYFKRYLALTHTLPALILALVVGCTALRTHGKETGYGGHVCYLNSVLLRGVAFVLPLAAAVTFNLVLLGLTARALSGAERVQNYGRQAEPNYIGIYARLSSLTGFCWLFALMAEIPGCEWLRYVSAVLNGLQGLHLAVSYCGNARVMKLWRVRLTRKAKDTGTATSTTSGGKKGQESAPTLSSTV